MNQTHNIRKSNIMLIFLFSYDKILKKGVLTNE